MKTEIIRKSVFETNSSSCHSLVIANGEDVGYGTIVPNTHGEIRLYGREYNTECLTYDDPKDRASYLLTAIYPCKPYHENDLEKYYADEFSASFDWTDADETYGDVIDRVLNIVKEQTGAKAVSFDLQGGYIDHCTEHLRNKSFDWSNESIKNFIFANGGSIFTGGSH